MSVTRVHKTKDYTMMSNIHFKDKSLSLKAKGLLSLMLSLPEDWDYSIEGLAALSNDGYTSVKTGLQELEKNNYLCRKRIYKDGKIADIEYHIFESPKDCNLYKQNLEVENLQVENQLVENLQVENNDNKILINKNTKDIKSNNKLFDTNKKHICQKVVDSYHDICVSYSKVRSLTDDRKSKIQKLIKKGYTLDVFKEAFTLAENSDFLKGKCGGTWKANFDFFLREDKLIAILEGKYGGSKQSRDGLNSMTDSHERKADMKRRIADGTLERI